MGGIALSHRQWEIVNLLQSYKSMSVENLAEYFEVTTTTIRRELMQLEKCSLITRSRGYAHIVEAPTVSPFDVRCQMCAQEKLLLARHALKYLQPSDTILLDAGSTIYTFAKEIAASDIPGLAVITYSIPIASILARNCLTIITGGTVDSATMSLVGPNAENSLDSVVANKLFLSTTGVNSDMGLTVTSQLSLGMKRKMMSRATEVFALIDSTKWSSAGLNIFCKLQELDHIITIRNEKNAESLKKLEDSGVKLDCIDMA